MAVLRFTMNLNKEDATCMSVLSFPLPVCGGSQGQEWMQLHAETSHSNEK